LLTPEQARQLAQQSVDAGSDAAAIKAALAADGIEWDADKRTPAERQWADDHETGHPERYRVDVERHFANDIPAEREAFGEVVRNFVAAAGFDRSAGSELAETIARTAAELRGVRPEARSQYATSQLARLGDKAPGLVADAAKALAGVNRDTLALLHRSGALDNAEVIVLLAHIAQARAARGGA
jgi:hypothetical protein